VDKARRQRDKLKEAINRQEEERDSAGNISERPSLFIRFPEKKEECGRRQAFHDRQRPLLHSAKGKRRKDQEKKKQCITASRQRPAGHRASADLTAAPVRSSSLH
jgi:hypothetical protein